VPEDKELLVQRVLQAQRDFQRLLTGTIGLPILRLNLTMQQLRVLLVVDFYRGRSSHDLTEALGVSPATMTGIIDRLVAQDLVSRREAAHDRRVRWIELTAAGQELLDQLNESRITQFGRILHGLDIDELRALERILGKLRHLAGQNTGSPGPAGHG
jgi:DNA-binding MarR family transcriptional regulator